MVQTAPGQVCFTGQEQPGALLTLVSAVEQKRVPVSKWKTKKGKKGRAGKAGQEEVRPDQGHATFLVAVVKAMPSYSITAPKPL